MGLYAKHVLPRLLHASCGNHELDALRAEACAPLAGRVVEIGFGSGSNVPFYPDAVEAVDAVEPSSTAWKLAGPRLAASPVPVRRSGTDGQALPHPDACFDAALSTWTLCTIEDPALALAELRRVLVPGGRLLFLEHGLAPDPEVRRLQHRIEPWQKRLAGGCHLTRRPVELLEDAGFEITVVECFYQPRVPRFEGAVCRGTAVSP
ncbi:class I SAM-dependent methyltransferase [Zafaria sp. Z1313]|uniref:class I SAM-dependent methyltransferase n=1 Tax=Zafaria sp. Z1313 TaxID=3423202 RepID=UPI003D301951